MAAVVAVPTPIPTLESPAFDRRTVTTRVLTVGVWLAAIIASIPLLSVLYMLVTRGGARLSLELFTELPPAGFDVGGGFGNAIVGTLVMVGIAAAIAVPFGILSAVYLAVLGPDSRLASAARFAAKTLTGLPSILAGVFAYAAVVLLTGGYSAPAGGVALALLMMPIVVLTAEEAMKMVPKVMKDAAYGMGCTQTQVIWKVVLPTAMPAILTGVMLAVARAAGETAPLLFTIGAATSYNPQLFDGANNALSAQIFQNATSSFLPAQDRAWGAALTLVLLTFLVTLVARVFTARLALKR